MTWLEKEERVSENFSLRPLGLGAREHRTHRL